MSKLLACMLFTVTALFGQAGGPVTITIHPGDWQLGPGSYVSQLPDGTPVVVIGGSWIQKDLGVTPAQLQAYPPGVAPYVKEGDYELSFPVANKLPTYPGYYQFDVHFGTQELCPAEGWGRKNFATATAICPGPGYIVIDQSLNCDQMPCVAGPVQSAKDIIIFAKNPGWPVYIKDVSLTFTPTQ